MTWVGNGTPEPLRPLCLARDHYTCQAPGCGYHDPTGRTLHADHIHNQARGGARVLDNLQTLCIPCHNRKTQREAHAAKALRRQRSKRRQPIHPAEVYAANYSKHSSENVC